MSWYDWIFGNKVLSDAAKQGDQQTPPPSKGDAGIDVAKMAQDQADAAKKQPTPAKPVAPADKSVHAYDWKRGNLNQ